MSSTRLFDVVRTCSEIVDLVYRTFELFISCAVIWWVSKTVARHHVVAPSSKPDKAAKRPMERQPWISQQPTKPPRFQNCKRNLRDASLAAIIWDNFSLMNGFVYYFGGNFAAQICYPFLPRSPVEKLEIVVEKSLLTDNMRCLKDAVAHLCPEVFIINAPKGPHYLIFEAANISPARAIEISFVEAGSTDAYPNFVTSRPAILSTSWQTVGQQCTISSFERVPLPEASLNTAPVLSYALQFKQKLFRYQKVAADPDSLTWDMHIDLITDARCIKYSLHRLAQVCHPFSEQEERRLTEIMKSWIKYVAWYVRIPITREEVKLCSNLGITLTDEDVAGFVATS